MKRHIWRRVGRNWGFRLKSPYVNSLFLRLMLLTAVITFASVFLASLLPFAYLSTELRADIENYNNQRLLHVKNTTDSTVFAPVMSAFSDIVLTDQVSQAPGFASAAGEVKPSGLYAVHGLLQKKTAQYSLADIALYNPGGRVLLSATYGVTYLTGTAVGLTGDVSWLGEISRISAGTRAAVWLEPRAFPDGSRQSGEASLLSLIAPLNSGGAQRALRLSEPQRYRIETGDGHGRTERGCRLFHGFVGGECHRRTAGGRNSGGLAGTLRRAFYNTGATRRSLSPWAGSW